MTSVKEYGRYSLDQLRKQISFIVHIDEIKTALQKAIKEKPEKLKALSPPIYWTNIYETTFEKHISAFILATGMSSQLEETMQTEDVTQTMFEIPIDHDTENLVNCSIEGIENKHVIGLYFSLLRSLDSMSIYGKYLHELIVDVRNGDDSALFKAVQIDRSIVSAPTVADRITLAEIEQDSEFFKSLSKALLRIKPKKPTETYSKLRYLLYILEQEQVLDTMTLNDKYNLFCEKLELYPMDGGDPAEGLKAFINRWKKSRGT